MLWLLTFLCPPSSKWWTWKAALLALGSGQGGGPRSPELMLPERLLAWANWNFNGGTWGYHLLLLEWTIFPQEAPNLWPICGGEEGWAIDSEIICLQGHVLLKKELSLYRTQQGEGENSWILAPKPGNIKKGPHLCNQLLLMCCLHNPTLYLEEACQPDKTFIMLYISHTIRIKILFFKTWLFYREISITQNPPN